MKPILHAAACLLTAASIAGCSSTPVGPTPAANASTASTPAPPAPGGGAANPVASSTVTRVTLPPHLDPNNPISAQRSVYFDFDDSAIKDEFIGLIERHGRYLQSNPGLGIKVEGNTDDRGGPEYNLALGQRRAEAVAKALRIHGARNAQIEAISWGEEHPLASGHDESSWVRNRRADLVYPHQ